MPSCVETFPLLDTLPFVQAAFLRRVPDIDVDADRETALQRLRPVQESLRTEAGLGALPLATAEQVHGAEVACVGPDDTFPAPGADGLLTTESGLCLGIYVADCAAVYLADSRGRGIALVHSGRKGTELKIVPRALEMLCAKTGAAPGDIWAVISPCIRPPYYEVDFAAEIRRQLQDVGAKMIEDQGTCTASNLDRYYSYRVEKGRTGRMLALLALK